MMPERVRRVRGALTLATAGPRGSSLSGMSAREKDSHPASLGEAQSSNPPDADDMIEPDADPLDTDVEDADLFLGEGDEEPDAGDGDDAA